MFASSSLRPSPRPAQEPRSQVGVPALGVPLALSASSSPSFTWASTERGERAQQGLQGEEGPAPVNMQPKATEAAACPFQPLAAFEKSQTYSSRTYTPSKRQHRGRSWAFQNFFLFSQSPPFFHSDPQSNHLSPVELFLLNVICTSLCKHCHPLFHVLTT